MQIFLTGGTGYVGQAVVQACLEYGHEVVLLTRPGSASVEFAMKGADAIIHLSELFVNFRTKGSRSKNCIFLPLEM